MRTNSSNWATSSNVSQNAAVLAASLNWIAVAVSPVSVFVGVPLTLITLVCMPYVTSVSKQSRLFYIVMAVSGLKALVFRHALEYLLHESVAFLSGRKVLLHFEGLSINACRLSRLAVTSGECMLAYLLTLFTLQRLVEMLCPFSARRLFGKRWTVATIVIVMSLSYLVNCTCFYLYLAVPNDPMNASCSPRKDSPRLILLLHFVNYVVPNCTLLVLSVLLFVSVRRYDRRRTTLHSRHCSVRSTVSGRSKHYQTTKILLALATLRCLVYVPGSLLYVSWQFVTESKVRIILRIVSNYFYILTGLTRVSDFLVYFFRIADFRRRVLLLFCCDPAFRLHSNV